VETKQRAAPRKKPSWKDAVPEMVTSTPIFRSLIERKYPTEFHKAIAEDTYVAMILEYVHDRMKGPLLRKIRALQRAALIASAYEDYAINGKSAPL
jgi:hypothetical protein